MTHYETLRDTAGFISTHMPLARHDGKGLIVLLGNTKFLLTCLLRGMTSTKCPCNGIKYNFYSHASCEAWLSRLSHTLRKEHFYSHASCEAWLGSQSRKAVSGWFLLTCLLRGMTKYLKVHSWNHPISTHMPLARHDYPFWFWKRQQKYFYSHASCEAWLLHIVLCSHPPH